RLEAGEPLGYVIGHVPFLGCNIFLDSHPLIPRPETEFWLNTAIKEIISSSLTRRNIKVLDLCSGSGAIGVAVAKHILDAKVDFAEVDPLHQKTIERNVTENNINPDRTRVIVGD